MAKDIGDKLGPRLAALIGKYVLAARRDHAPIEAKIRQVATQALIDKAGMEVAEHIRPLLEQAIDANPDMHSAIKDYLLRTASGKHQLQAIAGHLAMAGAGSVLGTLFNNELAPLVYGAVAANPHLVFDQQTSAAMGATGIITEQSVFNEGAALGYDSDRMRWLTQLAQAVPDSLTLGELVNRGVIREQDAAYWIQRGGYGPTLHGPLLELRKQLLTPADAALAVLRGAISHADGQVIAEHNGVSAADFDILIANTGEPPAAEQLLEAKRRGFIDEQRLVRGILQSRIRDEWVDVIEKLAYSPMSIADAVQAVVQGYFTDADAARIAEYNGLEPGQIETLIKTAGEPLSRTELEQLYNRGEVDKATVEQGLRESRLKNKYVPDAFKLHVRLPEPRQIVAMVTHGVIPKDKALHLLMEYGFAPDVAGYLLQEGIATKVGVHKDLTIAEIKSLFIEGIFTDKQAREHLATLGYDTPEADALIADWHLIAGAAITRQAVGVVRSRYVAHDISWQHANTDLDALGIPATAKETYKRVWDIEREARTAALTEAQIVHAHKTNLISGPDAYARLLAKGYSDGDAHILLGVAPNAAIPA